jgi:hypothetical protein
VSDTLSLVRDGAQLHVATLSPDEIAHLQALADRRAADRPGARLFAEPAPDALLSADGVIGALAVQALGPGARPVRAVLLDKTRKNNWSVAWHQDRTIAVCERIDVPGFGPWSKKAGAIHVAPPFALLERMITVRAHLDPCPSDNAPLLMAPGSHRLGWVSADRAAAEAERLGTSTCLAEAGDVWVYSTPILHASARALTPTRRRVLQIDFAAEDLPGGLEWLGV